MSNEINFSDFSYGNYKKILETLASSRKNFTFSDFKDNPEKYNDSFFILRHDVDYSPKYALALAQKEADWGFRATYFLLMSSGYYNLLSAQYFDFAKELVALGHEVGLHYDIAAMEKVGGADIALALEISILEQLSGTQIKSMSMHNPSISGKDPFCQRNDLPYINAYDSKYCSDITYFSDSCGAWRDQAVEAFKTDKIPARMQFLIHPLFWVEKNRSRWQALDDVTAHLSVEAEKRKKHIRSLWLEHTGVQQHDARYE